MRLGSTLLFAACAGALLASTPLLASPTAGSVGDICSNAANRAALDGTTTEADLASCNLAVRLAYYEPKRAAALANRGVLLFVSGNYDAAIADSTAALELDNQLAQAYLNRGAALLQQHRSREAVTDLTQALALAPEHPERVYFNRAMAREDLGDLKGAYADYREAAALNPQWDLPQRQLSRFSVTPSAPLS